MNARAHLVAVTGASGFIGRATCKALVASGNEVRALVRNDLRETILPPVVETVITGDLATADHLERALANTDVVIHLAARVPNRAGLRGHAQAGFFDANVLATERVLRAAAGSGVKRFLYVSSVKAVAEQSSSSPLNEATPPDPTEPYGRSKLAGEETAKALGAALGIEVVVIRPPLVYGPGAAGHFWALIKLARLAHWVPLPLGGISNRRSFLFVDNLASALVLLSGHPASAGETFFIADGPAVSTSDLIRAIGVALGVRVKLFPIDSSMFKSLASLAGVGAEIEKLYASLEVDDARLRHKTGWVAPFSFEEAMAITVGRPLALVHQEAPA